VILDAGSSGTRVHIYKWLDNAKARLNATPKELQSLPKLTSNKKWTKKVHPGVSAFAERPSAVGEEHLKGLLEHALSVVPKDQIADTPLFLMATAGVRLLSDNQRAALLNEICRYAQSTTSFSLPSCDLHIQAIPGETEGLYGWIAANYLLGGFDSPESHAHGKGHHTYGFLDMGGASAQIAFAPNQTESEKHANDLRLLRMRKLNGESSEYKVFVATWLGFGVNQARVRYVDALEESIGISPGARELPDPCLPAGLITTTEGEIIDSAVATAGSQPYLLGQGLFDECLKKTYPLLDKDAPCEDQPCLLHGQHVPAIDFDVNHFVGVSEYWHTTHEVFEMSYKDKAYDFNTYQKRVNEFCSQKWSDIENGVKSLEWGKKVDEKTAMELCFKASWLISVLHDGIGIPRVGLETTPTGYNGTKDVLDHLKEKGFLDPFRAVDKIDNTEVSWTLGKMVLYAAGQIKPSEDTLAVGFGSNVASGIPADFQYAGSNYTEGLYNEDDGFDGDGEDFEDIAEDFMESVPKKSTSSIVLLLLVLLFVGYVFRKRERRKRVYKKFGRIFRNTRRPSSPRKGGRGIFSTGKLFGRNSDTYERVLEEGEANEFELHDIDSDENDHSDSSDSSRTAKSTGMATPKLSYSDLHHFEAAPTHGANVGLGLNGFGIANAMDRSGLVVRTESRERLAPSMQMLGAGRRSRTGSPIRGKSPLMTPLQED
jgi:golgi apyrase